MNSMKWLQTSPGKMPSVSANYSDDNLSNGDHGDNEEDAPKQRVRRRFHQFSDSDSDREVPNENDKLMLSSYQEKNKIHDIDDEDAISSTKYLKSRIQASNGTSSDSDASSFGLIKKKSRIKHTSHSSGSDSDGAVRNITKKSRIQNISQENSSDSDSSNSNITQQPGSKTILKSIPLKSVNHNSSDSDQDVKNEQQIRMKNKQNKMKDKFKGLITSRKEQLSAGVGNEQSPDKEDTKSSNSSGDDDDTSSIEKIKQKIKERMSYKPSICDPDTSDEETVSHHKSMPKQRKEKKIKLTSPKPQRMSAKQAMENMQKIKSESNRMLREKEVSLPYHRPKALSLKDIMSRRKPALSSDGKCLPIKMSGEQLKQYAQLLQDRQKEMMELWQSDTDEEHDDKKSDDEKHDEKTAIDEPKSVSEDADDKEVNAISEKNDKLFDDLSQSIIEGTKTNESREDNIQVEPLNGDKVAEEQDSETNMKLVFNDSETSITEEKHDTAIKEGTAVGNIEADKANETDINNEKLILDSTKPNTDSDSQHVSLHYDSEKTEIQTDKGVDAEIEKTEDIEKIDKDIEAMDVDGFSDEDMNIEDIDNIIENAEIIRDIEDKVNSQVLIRDRPLNLNPKLTGAPGMVIDLDDCDTLPKKSGVELLKERFTFFAKLKTPDELERNKERQIKPYNQHSRLKLELEEQMAEQRCLEWTKRLEEEKQQKKELNELRGDESDDENDIDKIEAKLEENDANKEVEEESESEEELLENDIDKTDKPRANNPLLENEADESDCDENELKESAAHQTEEDNAEVGDDEAESSDESESSESEEEQASTRKGRILKAFEDSDDESAHAAETNDGAEKVCSEIMVSQAISQDDVLTLAQRHKSEDLFTSQSSCLLPSQQVLTQAAPEIDENDVATQTFSILDSANTTSELNNANMSSDKLNVICETQPCDDNIDNLAVLCSGSFSQSLPPLPFTQLSQSQTIGEDVVALCTGRFYENKFISQVEEINQTPLGASQEFDSLDIESQRQTQNIEPSEVQIIEPTEVRTLDKLTTDKKEKYDDNLKSILDELDDPEFDVPKPNRFFCGATQKQVDAQRDEVVKKKLVIDSDDDNDANTEVRKLKKKKRKPEKRALQISDDEDEVSEVEEYESEIEEENEERLVEYDSEENEIEVKSQILKPSKKKRKGTEFFEQEAELTSEDEWAGSGDEDEAGLDRMEREAGDDEKFHEGRLQRELGQIHMREVIDQDKREVRIIQELLFEDGDLGAGGRQRKFKWKNLDGDEEIGTIDEEFKDTQEEEFESEEQWRKQRHERETFLRQMQNNDDQGSLNISINRSSIIKANLMSKSMSMLLEENQPQPNKNTDTSVEKKTGKDIPSLKKPFSLLQQSYQGSILNRGRGALARLAALATPLAVDDDAPKGKSAATSSRRNFVFATLTPEAPKVTKRKAVANPGTPALVKKIKTEENQTMSKSRLLDHMKL